MDNSEQMLILSRDVGMYSADGKFSEIQSPKKETVFSMTVMTFSFQLQYIVPDSKDIVTEDPGPASKRPAFTGEMSTHMYLKSVY